jgi:WD domain, G-beta repeat
MAVEDNWGTFLQKLEGRSDWVWVVAFSLDGQFLASGSGDMTVRLWDSRKKETIQILNTEGSIYNLSFSNDGLYLKTERGLFELSSVGQPQSDFPSYLYVKDKWVAYRTENILWLPVDYQPTCLAVQENILVIGYVSSRVAFIKVDLIWFCQTETPWQAIRMAVHLSELQGLLTINFRAPWTSYSIWEYNCALKQEGGKWALRLSCSILSHH